MVPPEVPLPFSDQNPDLSDSYILPGRPPNPPEPDGATCRQRLEEFLETNEWGIEDVREFIRREKLDLQREPEYSRQIFEKLLARSPHDLTEPIKFLEDPFLNTRGSGNYLAAVELFVRMKASRHKRTPVLNAINRALELGLVPANELCLIIKALPNIIFDRKKRLGRWDPRSLVKHYKAMWKAIGRCNVLGHRDLRTEIVDAWLGELVLNTPNFRFAGEIILATHDAHSGSFWTSKLIEKWLETMVALNKEETMVSPETLLDQLDANCAADCIIRVTESLCLSSRDKDHRNQLIELWRNCLSQVTNTSAIAVSQIWVDLPMAFAQRFSDHDFPLDHFTQRQIILRLWVLRTLDQSQHAMWYQGPRATKLHIYTLLNLYEMAARSSNESFLADLLRGIHDLDLPLNNLLLLAVNRKLGKGLRRLTRKTLERLETSKVSLAEVWTNPSAYNGIHRLFYSSFDQMFRRMDLTSPEGVEKCLRLARTGDSKSVWTILRLLRHHIPLKICLNRAWVPLPHPDDKALVRYYPEPRDSQCPDPHAAADLIHRLAVAFSCSQLLNASRSFKLIHWLYGYLRRHGGPVYPSLVRAMYHAGVVRYRREGRRVAPTQYKYILWIVQKFEGRKVVEQLTAPPRIGQKYPGRQEDSL